MASSIVNTSGKAMASAILVAGAWAFLWTFGPRRVALHADIYVPLAAAAGFLPPPPGEGPRVRYGHAVVNGAPFTYAIGTSSLPLAAVLSHYEKQFEVTPREGPPLLSAVRVEEAGAGVIAGIKFGAIAHPADVRARIGAFSGSRQLNDLGEFHLVSVFEQRGTVFIDFTPGPQVTVDTLLPSDGSDAPGEDLHGVARPPHLRRLFTIDHGSQDARSRTLIYRAAQASDAVASFRRAFSAAGWKSNPAVNTVEVSHFTDGTREAFLAAAGAGDDAAIIIVHRMRTHASRRS